MHHFKLSFIVPCYNGFDKLRRLIEDFKNLDNQSEVEFEVIIIDDGSDTDFDDVLEHNHFLYKKANGGVSSARNYGLLKVSGDYVIFIDCDDTIVNNTLSLIYDTVINNKSDVFLFSHHYIDNEKVVKKVNKNIAEVPSDVILEMVLNKKVLFHNCAMVYKKNHLEKNILQYNENLKYSEDVFFILTAINKAKKVTVTEKVFYHYIDNVNGAINQSFDKKMLNQLHTFDLIKKIEVSKYQCKSLNYFVFTCACHSLVRAFKAKEYDENVLIAFIQYSRKISFPYFLNTDKYYIFCLFVRFFSHLPTSLLVRIKRLIN